MDSTVHERDYFRYKAFTYDLLKYSAKKFDHTWSLPHIEQMENYRTNKRFLPQVGDAILKYRRRHLKEIAKEINDLEAHGTMRDILLTVAAVTFRGENYIKEYFRFCAQIATMGLHYLEQGQFWQLEFIVCQMDGVYNTFLKQRFVILGGWNVLQRYAVRYCIYRK